jgi:hypothetical protein
MDRLLPISGNGTDEPAAELGQTGMTLVTVLGHHAATASPNAQEHIGA